MLETEVKKFGGIEMNETEHLEYTAKLAADFMLRWGCVAGVPDGEDSSGRQKGRLMTPKELVDRAVASATLMMDRLREEGLVHNSPTLEEIESIKKSLKED